MNPTIVWWMAYWLNIIVTALTLNIWTAIAAIICIGGFALAERSEEVVSVATRAPLAGASDVPVGTRGSASGRR